MVLGAGSSDAAASGALPRRRKQHPVRGFDHYSDGRGTWVHAHTHTVVLLDRSFLCFSD